MKQAQRLCGIFTVLFLSIMLAGCFSHTDTTETDPVTAEVSSISSETAEEGSETENDISSDPDDRTGQASSTKTKSSQTEKNDVSSTKSGTMEIQMLNVGQGLCLLIQSDGHSMLYDGGGRKSSSYVVSYLKKQDITDLDYIFVSHYDEDHISGLIGILHTAQVSTAVTPDLKADTSIYRSFRSALKENGAKEEHPEPGDRYRLGSAEIMVLAPESYSDGSDNGSSIAVRVNCGKVSCLITGDADEAEESEIVSSGRVIDSDIYIVGHHGSSSSSSDSFIRAVSPQCALLSCGRNNSYGHPTERVLNTLKKYDVDLYRTDIQKEIILKTDGSTYHANVKPTDDWSAGSKASEEAEKTASRIASGTSSEESTYILNLHTKKFHYPSCPSVDQMKESNKGYTDLDRDTLISQGYSPCGRCNP